MLVPHVLSVFLSSDWSVVSSDISVFISFVLPWLSGLLRGLAILLYQKPSFI